MDKITEVLKKLENNKINYTVLRGYIPIEEIEKSKDVDLYIPIQYKKVVDDLLKKDGWYTPLINCSRYPHKQYIRVTESKVQKLDIVYGIFYSGDLLKFNLEHELLNMSKKECGIYVLNFLMGIVTFVIHLIFDKKEISEKNYNYLVLMYNNYNKEYCTIDCKIKETFLDIARDILDTGREKANLKIKDYEKIIKELGIVKKNNYFFVLYQKIILRLKNIIRFSWLRLSKKNIAIVGIDGSGKSTTIEKLKNILGEKCMVQYMGFKDYEIDFIKKHFLVRKNNIFYKLGSYILPKIDMLKRYLKNRFKKEVTLFDRYVEEAFINNFGIKKILYFLQYKIFFPKVKMKYYLYCSVETSLERKNDIENEKEFIKMKKRFDKYYLNKRKIKSISTDELSQADVIKTIIDDINSNMIKYLI